MTSLRDRIEKILGIKGNDLGELVARAEMTTFEPKKIVPELEKLAKDYAREEVKAFVDSLNFDHPEFCEARGEKYKPCPLCVIEKQLSSLDT